MADDLDDEWWVGAQGDSASDSNGSDLEDDGDRTSLLSKLANKNQPIEDANKRASGIVDSKASKCKTRRTYDLHADSHDGIQGVGIPASKSKKVKKSSKSNESFAQQDAPFGKFNGPAIVASGEPQEDIIHEALVKRRESNEEGLLDGEPLKKKKKRKRRNKTQALAECKNPVEPIKEFMDILKAKQAQMTVVERDEVDLDAVNVIQETLDGVKNVDLSTALLGSLARCGTLLSRQAKPKGQPFVLIVTASAIRAMDMKRNLQRVSPECKVAKLFAKHIKISEQVENMTKSCAQVAVGTPKRIYELIELDALKLSKLKYILLDWTWRDSKLRRIADIAEIKQDLLTLSFKHLLVKSIKYSTQVILL